MNVTQRWFTDASGVRVSIAEVVSSNRATEDIMEVAQYEDGHVRTTRWKRAGSRVTDGERLWAAAENSTDPLPTGDINPPTAAGARYAPMVDPPIGNLAQRPAAHPDLLGGVFTAVDVDGGQTYLCNGSSWVPAGAPVDPVYPAAPADLDGLAVHYRAASLALANGAPVTNWPDDVGANDLNQATAAAQPVFAAAGINGRPTVRFLSDYMDTAALWVNPSQPFYLGMLSRFVETGAHSRDWIHRLTAGERWLGYSLPDDAVQTTLGTTALPATSPHVSGEPHWWALVYDGATLAIKRDGVTIGSAARTLAANAGAMRVGANGGGITGGASELGVAEIVAYGRALTSREERSLGRHMRDLYGVGA